MLDKRITFVICTCDSYKDAWFPLFTLFERYWPSLKDVDIVLNTETAVFEYPGFNIRCPQLYKGMDNPAVIPWSKRLKETLVNEVKTDLVILYLDDFYLRSPVDKERLDICIDFMGRNDDAGCMLLYTCPLPYTSNVEHPWILKRNIKAPYLFSLQAGLWRKDKLIHYLRDHESPWYFERWGSLRARRYSDNFYALSVVDGKQAIFDYSPSEHGLTQGKWRPKTQELFDKEQIKVDLSIRGLISETPQTKGIRRNWIKTFWNIFKSLKF